MDSNAAAAAAAAATATITAHARTKAVFCVALLHSPRHQLIGFTAPNTGKTYFSAVDVCRILQARDPHALAQHIGPCQMRNVAPFSGRLFLYPSSWVVEYHGLLHFLDHVLLDRERSTLPEQPARRLKKFLQHGVVLVPAPLPPPNPDHDDGGVILLKEADAETQIQAIAALSENTTSNNNHPTPHQCNPYSHDNDYNDVDDVEPFAPAAEGGAPAPSSIQPFVLWMFEQQWKMLYQGT